MNKRPKIWVGGNLSHPAEYIRYRDISAADAAQREAARRREEQRNSSPPWTAQDAVLAALIIGLLAVVADVMLFFPK